MFLDILLKVLDGYNEFQLHIYGQRKLIFRFSSNFFKILGWVEWIYFLEGTHFDYLQGLVTLNLYMIFALKYTQAIK